MAGLYWKGLTDVNDEIIMQVVSIFIYSESFKRQKLSDIDNASNFDFELKRRIDFGKETLQHHNVNNFFS